MTRCPLRCEGECVRGYPRAMLSDVSRFLPKSHHLSDRIPTLFLSLMIDMLCDPVYLILGLCKNIS